MKNTQEYVMSDYILKAERKLSWEEGRVDKHLKSIMYKIILYILDCASTASLKNTLSKNPVLLIFINSAKHSFSHCLLRWLTSFAF